MNTKQKLGTPVLVITGEWKSALRAYSNNRERRDPVYRQEAIEAALKRSPRTRPFRQRGNFRRSQGGGGHIQLNGGGGHVRTQEGFGR